MSYSKVLIVDKTSNNRVQFVLKLSMDINPKIFRLLYKLHRLPACGDFVLIKVICSKSESHTLMSA